MPDRKYIKYGQGIDKARKEERPKQTIYTPSDKLFLEGQDSRLVNGLRSEEIKLARRGCY